MKIYGYSERGMINSLIFTIGEDLKLMNKFISQIAIHNKIDFGNPIDYKVMLEQSLSDFGDSDLIVLIDYEGNIGNKVLFIEGKVKTFQGKWDIKEQFAKFNNSKKYHGYASNLFFQLHLKKLLMDNWTTISVNHKVDIIEFLVDKQRKIGENEIVKKAFNMLANREAYYIGLVPTLKSEIDSFKRNNETGIHFLSWETVEEFCNKNNLINVLEMFDYNKGQIY